MNGLFLIHMTRSRLSCPKISAPSAVSAVNNRRNSGPEYLGGRIR